MSEESDRRRWIWGAVIVAVVALLGVLALTGSGDTGYGPGSGESIPELDEDANAGARQFCIDEAADTLEIRSVSQTTTADGNTYTVQLFSDTALLATCVVEAVNGGAFELVSLTQAE